MARLFDNYQRTVPTWLAAARYLDGLPGRRAMNLLLEIPDPLGITAEDRQIMDRVDVVLRPRDLTLRTVAGTIFPIDLYRRNGRPGFYAKYLDMIERGKRHGTWGTYAARMVDRPGKLVGTRINALEMLVQRLSDAGQPHKESGEDVSYVSTYELGVAVPEDDLARGSAGEHAGELPTYDAALDGRRWLGLPCLSHVSFKRVPTEAGHAVNLTAVYRSHHYCERALGNLLGLAQLLSFVAKESGLAVGTLSCVSSYAKLDVEAWGGVNAAQAVLA